MRTTIFVFLLLLTSFNYAQNIGINNTGAIPNASAMLDVESTDKGVLIPRVNIADLTTAAPVTTPATSLLVYNTNTTTGEGYYYWDATKWVKLLDGNTTADHDWYEVGTTTAPNSITDNIFTQGKVEISTPNYVPLRVERTSTSTSGILGTIASSAKTSGNMVDNFGSRIDFTIEDNASVANEIAHIGAVRKGADDSGQLRFWTENAGVDGVKMVIEPSGNVGIGTVSPVAKVHLFNQTGDTKMLIQADPTNTDENDNAGVELWQDGNLVKGYMGMLDGLNVGFLGTTIVGRGGGNALVLNTYTSNPSTSNGRIDLATNDTVRMVVNGVNGNVGINTTAPTEKLQINGSIKIVDGTQGVGKVLTSDANGKASWNTNIAITPTIIGSVGSAYTDFTLATTSYVDGWYIDLPAGKWVVSIGGLLRRPTYTTNTYYGARLTLSSSSTSIVNTGFSYIGSSLVLNIKSTNGNSTGPGYAGFVSGMIIVNVTTPQRLYLWNNNSNGYSVGSSGHGFGSNGENYFVASPIN